MTKIAFETGEPADLFYSTANQKQLQKADKQLRNGQVVEKTMDELKLLEQKVR